jgi:hypothetical protein
VFQGCKAHNVKFPLCDAMHDAFNASLRNTHTLPAEPGHQPLTDTASDRQDDVVKIKHSNESITKHTQVLVKMHPVA